MTDRMIDESLDGEMPRGEMSQCAAAVMFAQDAAERYAREATTMQGNYGDTPRGGNFTTGTERDQEYGGEMPRGAMEDTSTAFGSAGGSGADMTAGATAGNDMPRGDVRRFKTQGSRSSAGNGDMPRGEMTESAGMASAMPTGQAQGLQATLQEGMKIIGSWSLTISGVSLNA